MHIQCTSPTHSLACVRGKALALHTAYSATYTCTIVLLCVVFYDYVAAVEEARIYKAGGWVEFNRVNGETYTLRTPCMCTYMYMLLYTFVCLGYGWVGYLAFLFFQFSKS